MIPELQQSALRKLNDCLELADDNDTVVFNQDRALAVLEQYADARDAQQIQETLNPVRHDVLHGMAP